MRGIHVDSNLNYYKVEQAFRIAVNAQEKQDYKFADFGWNMAQARSPSLLKALESAANIMTKEDDHQRGQSRHTADTEAEKIYTTETQMFQKAYETLDKGTPEQALMWIYGAGAWLAGFIDRPTIR